MSLPTAHLIQHTYAQTRFKTTSRADRDALVTLTQQGPFAIITGYAPTGEEWTTAENQAADRSLRHALPTPIRIIGYDPTGPHQEPSWATALPLNQALALGTTYHQLAIFYINAGTLSIHPCNPETPPHTVGNFLSRLD